MTDRSLVGPPELQNQTGSDDEQQRHISGDAFMDQMVARFNTRTLPARLARGLTKNNSPTYLTTGDPCVDFFFHGALTEKLRLAWEHDRLTTLKLVFNLRGVRGTGKSDREGFFTAAIWLLRNDPGTFVANFDSLAEFGCFKDFLEILYRLLEGPDVRRKQKAAWLKRKRESRNNRKEFEVFQWRRSSGKQKKRLRSSVPREIRISQANERSIFEKEQARTLRKKNIAAMATKLINRYTRDCGFRFLYDRISDFFAERLKADVALLKSGELRKLSLAAKWCPSLDSSFDRSTLLCESIAKIIFPRDSIPEYDGIEEAHYSYRVRDRLRKQVLVPLRKALELPEVFIGANQWHELPYNRVPSMAMMCHKDKFLTHDGERFMKYLNDKNVSASTLLPLEIVAELQWKRSIKTRRKMKSSLAVCDVSKGMKRIGVEASLTLGLIVSEMSEDPWKGKIVTFSENPQLHLVKGDNLKSKVDFMKKTKLGENQNQKKKDIQKVFDLILDVAIAGELKEDEMIKRVFVFSDMEFDRASPDNWETNYDVIVRKFAAKGYAASVPEIVFWNLRGSKAIPVPAKQKGTALLSGFSKNLIKVFLDDDVAGDNFNPQAVMRAVISGEEYQRLVLGD